MHPIPESSWHVLRTLVRGVPTLVILGSLAAVALWGHSTGWTFASARATAPTVTDVDVTLLENAAGMELRFRSAEAVEMRGIEAEPVTLARMPLVESITATGEIHFAPGRVVHLPARVGGKVLGISKAVGSTVAKGEALAILDSNDVAKAKADYLQALVSVRQARNQLDSVKLAGKAMAERFTREAEAALNEAEVTLLGREQTLHNIGLPLKSSEWSDLTLDDAASKLRSLGFSSPPLASTYLPVLSPMAGTLLEAEVVNGETVTAGQVLFEIVDASQVTLVLQVPEQDSKRVRAGLPVLFQPQGTREEFRGVVAAVGTTTDSARRTVAVRVEYANAEGKLRAGLLGQGRIVLREVPQAVVVPQEAVRILDGRTVLFVRDPQFFQGAKAFRVRPVTTGLSDDGNIEIVSGLKVGEVIAAKGAAWLADEIQRQRTAGAKHD
ncbi:efflux RND transporter periplasmic adaptor subunit [soil metagenome]